MARSTENAKESLEIEVLRNASQLQTSSACTLVTNCTPDTIGCISDSSLTYCNRKGAELTPMRVMGNGEQKNGCCHSTPLLGSAANNMQLKEYFGKLSLPVTPIVPCAGSKSHFQQDATNVLIHRPIDETLLELAATRQSNTDRLHFGGIGLQAGLASGLRANHAAEKTTDTDSDVPVCVLVQLSRKRPKKLPTLQYKAILKHNGIPEDILTKLHICPMPKKQGQQT